MGLESYFVPLVPTSALPDNGNSTLVAKSHLRVSAFIEKLSMTPYALTKRNWRFVVDEILFMSVESEGESLRTITLEGCFSCFEESLHLCFQVAQSINANIIAVRVLHPAGLDFSLGSESEFCSKVRSLYHDQLQGFIEQFGPVKFRSLPGTQFYQSIHRKARTRKALNLIKRILRP